MWFESSRSGGSGSEIVVIIMPQRKKDKFMSSSPISVCLQGIGLPSVVHLMMMIMEKCKLTCPFGINGQISETCQQTIVSTRECGGRLGPDGSDSGIVLIRVSLKEEDAISKSSWPVSMNQ